jgi:hypothetical protein
MKQIVGSLCVLLAASSFSHAASAQPAYEFQLDESEQAAAGDADAATVPAAKDPNDADFKPETSKEKPAAKPAKAAAKEPEPRDIPLIERSDNAVSHPDVTYVTGGIGEGEKSAIEASKADYNLHVMSASASGAFVGDAQVLITRKKGKEQETMLSVITGPLLYVRLPAGTYLLEARLGEQAKRQSFTVAAKGKSANIHLSWKVAATPAE